MPGTTGPPSIVQPQLTEELTTEYRALYGIPSTEPGQNAAVFFADNHAGK